MNKPNTEINSENDCDSCSDFVIRNDGTVDFDTMVSCGRQMIICGLKMSGTRSLVVGYTGLGQLDSSDKYADLLMKMTINDPYDSIFFYYALAHKAINAYMRTDCHDSNFHKFEQVWNYQTVWNDKEELRTYIFRYYLGLLYNCGKYGNAISKCYGGFRRFGNELHQEKKAYAYEILALSHKNLGFSQDTVCAYIDSSLHYFENERVVQHKTHLCR